jgi:hypothetical protein
VRLARAAVAERDDVFTRDDEFAARQLQHHRLVERRKRDEIESVERFDGGKLRRPDAPLHHPPLAVDQLKLGQAQQIARMIEPLFRRFLGDLVVFALKGRQLQLAQMMRQQHLRRVGCGGRLDHAALRSISAM